MKPIALFPLLALLGCTSAPMRPRADGGFADDGGPVPVGDGGPGSDGGPVPVGDGGPGSDGGPLADAASSDAGPPMTLHLLQNEVVYRELDSFRAAGSPEARVLYPDGVERSSGPTTRSTYTRPFTLCSPVMGPLVPGGPANCMTWGEAFALCAYMGMRLPTEAEWLSEAGAPHAGEIRDTTSPADTSFPPCYERMCDARGNVSEWVVGSGPVLFVAMGESYRSAETRRADPAPDAEIGVRCWGRAR